MRTPRRTLSALAAIVVFLTLSAEGCDVKFTFGTQWQGPEEKWAGANGIVYGHLHVHCMLPTLVLETADGKTYRILDEGRLRALDDARVRDLAATYGDPDEMLAESWTPPLPGVTAPGTYADYARDPAAYVYGAVAAEA